jgi:hypothetical protein
MRRARLHDRLCSDRSWHPARWHQARQCLRCSAELGPRRNGPSSRTARLGRRISPKLRPSKARKSRVHGAKTLRADLTVSPSLLQTLILKSSKNAGEAMLYVLARTYRESRLGFLFGPDCRSFVVSPLPPLFSTWHAGRDRPGRSGSSGGPEPCCCYRCGNCSLRF